MGTLFPASMRASARRKPKWPTYGDYLSRVRPRQLAKPSSLGPATATRAKPEEDFVAEDLLQRLADERELNALLIRYCRGVDRCDEELIRSCYHPDAMDDHGAFKGSGWDFAAYITKAHKGRPLKQHALSNVSLEIRGDIAWGESYSEMRTTTASGELVYGFGRYIDRFERRGGEWRIADRRVTVEGVASASGFDASDFVQGRQDRSDPSYER